VLGKFHTYYGLRDILSFRIGYKEFSTRQPSLSLHEMIYDRMGDFFTMFHRLKRPILFYKKLQINNKNAMIESQR